ncbi:hypothetical protein UFOVP29_33 [uncultured Caudovirales phage]|uniref:Cytidyltransferase-like domain-containing protein n=1 Tax=uncultured Caudovirales phage TaxID=2100421 RepID=A0A6J5KK29_9CAUD|nr:hypothetical protein UFOVP29_33 [uncultured Caudovirales phage]
MKLFELFEQDESPQAVVFTFGNMNPPHAGHLGLVRFAVDTAKKNHADWHIYLSESAGVMTPDQKVAWLTAWCQAAGIDAKGHIHHVPRIHQSAIDLYHKGFREAIFVAGGKKPNDPDKSDFEKYWPLIDNANKYNQANVNPEDVKYFYFDPLTGRENKPSEGGAGRITSGTAVRTAAEQTLTGDEEAVKTFWQAASAGDATMAKKIAGMQIGGMTYLQTVQQGLKSGAKVTRPGAKKKTVSEEKAVWDKPNPVKDHKKLSDADKAAARARAKKAGRKYPNMVDNMWAAKRK